jgi:hypothetical protein
VEKQILFEDDRKKSKSKNNDNSNSQCGDLSTALRSG